MIVCKTKKWGNSLGLLIPKKEAVSLGLRDGQEVAVELTKKTNPLRELFGFGKTHVITKQDFSKTRRLLESKT